MYSLEYFDEVEELLFRTPIPALLADMLEFIHEALACSKKGWLIPAYALLRKPLKESLFYFEWMLADRESFLSSFRSERWYKYSASNTRSFQDSTKEMKKHEKIDLISEAMNKTQAHKWVSPEMIYDIRYSRKLPFCLGGEFDQANHLVTSYRDIRTSSENFNFIFSGKDERYSQWRHLYNTLPILLFHTYNVIFSLINSFVPESKNESSFLPHIKVKAGLYLWHFDTEYWTNWPNPFASILKKEEFEKTLCRKCGKKVLEVHMDIETVYYSNDYICCRCKHPAKYLKILFWKSVARYLGISSIEE